MASPKRKQVGRKMAGPQTSQVGAIEPFSKGVNSIAAFSQLRQGECHYSYNILPSEGGPRTRLGSREWTNGITGTPKTIIPFHGKADDRTDDKLFITGSDGIYDCSSSGAGAATKVYTFATTGSTAGYGTYITWTTAAGLQFIQYADSANGLLEYDAAGDTWAPVTGITGLSELVIRHVMVHKLRIWYILADDPNAYYLPVDAKTGAAAAFQLGSKYTIGGDTALLVNYTRDTGAGPDDLFLAISRGGDVLVYAGLDPSAAATWSLVGSWKVGTIPDGRRFAIEYGGDVLLLSVNGLTSVNDLFSAKEVQENVIAPYGKITNRLRDRLVPEIREAGWELNFFAAEGYFVVQSPQRPGNGDEWIQYCLHNTIGGWGFWRGLESQVMGSWRETFYFAKADGSVWYMNGTKDNASIASPAGVDVEFSFLTRFSDMELPGRQKMATLVRPFFVGSTLTSYTAKVIYDYQILELVSAGEAGISGGFVWDTGVWDQAIWGGETPFDNVFGTGNVGLSLGVACKGSTGARIYLAELSVTHKPGGYL